jgi:rhamnosyltransferase subunit B
LRFLIASLGSLGDLHPFLALARALTTQGHDVELMSNAPYRAAVEQEGVRFSPLCTEREHLRTASHPDLWHPIRGFGVLWRHLAVPAIDPVLDRIRELHLDAASPLDRLFVLASPLAVGARLAREVTSARLGSIYTAPANLRPLGNPMFVGPYRVPAFMPLAIRRGFWWGLDKWKLEPMGRAGIAARCESLGIDPPRGSLFGRWVHSPDGGVALFPERFGPIAPADGTAPVERADFPRFRATGDNELPASLLAFLKSGPAPVVAFGGSAPGPQGRELLRLASQACRALGKRLVILAPERALEGLSLPVDDEQLIRVQHAPLAELLPRVESFIHHGGIGSCAEAIEAGIPQVVMPFAFDQFDNAARVAESHAGFVVDYGKTSASSLLHAIRDAEHLPQAPMVGRAQRHTRGTDAAVQAVHRWIERSLRK